jgi:hypothetical protein
VWDSPAKGIGFGRFPCLQRSARTLPEMPQELLDLMPDLVRQYARLGEFAGSPEPALSIRHRSRVHVDVLVRRTIKRSRSRLRKTTGRVRRTAEQHQFRVPVRYAVLSRQNALPGLLGIIKHAGYKLYECRFCGALNGATRGLIGCRNRV